MGQKRTELDEQYTQAFAAKLRPHYLLAKRKGQSDRAFAETLDISDTQLQNYLGAKQTPGLRTVALAFQEYGIAVPYGVTSTTRLLGRGAKAGKPAQLLLPFTIQQRAGKKVAVRVHRRSTSEIDVLVKIG